MEDLNTPLPQKQATSIREGNGKTTIQLKERNKVSVMHRGNDTETYILKELRLAGMSFLLRVTVFCSQ